MENRSQYFNIYGSNGYRIKDIEADRLLVNSLIVAAIQRHPGSRLSGYFTNKDILRLLDLQSNLCVGCDANIRYSFTVDHIIPQSRGGSNHVDNIQLLCQSCNSSKCDMSMAEWLSTLSYRKEVKRRGQTVELFGNKAASRLILGVRLEALYNNSNSIKEYNEKLRAVKVVKGEDVYIKYFRGEKDLVGYVEGIDDDRGIKVLFSYQGREFCKYFNVRELQAVP